MGITHLYFHAENVPEMHYMFLLPIRKGERIVCMSPSLYHYFPLNVTLGESSKWTIFCLKWIEFYGKIWVSWVWGGVKSQCPPWKVKERLLLYLHLVVQQLSHCTSPLAGLCMENWKLLLCTWGAFLESENYGFGFTRWAEPWKTKPKQSAVPTAAEANPAGTYSATSLLSLPGSSGHAELFWCAEAAEGCPLSFCYLSVAEPLVEIQGELTGWVKKWGFSGSRQISSQL